MTSFNLLDEPWIPCSIRGTITDMGVRETLCRAQEVDEIIDSSPLTTVSMHRLLLAILHRVFGPDTDKAWGRLWDDGWDLALLSAYLEQWRDRFDLFDPDRPFYQNPGIDADRASIRRLTHELGPANDELFTHLDDEIPFVLDPGQCARYLLAYNSFSPGGLVSLQKHEDSKHHKFARAAPLSGSAVALVRGRNLAETLLLNMVAYDGENQPFAVFGDDLPAWEQSEPVRAAERRPNGYLDWLTWQCRRVRLFPVDTPAGVVVDRVLIMKGNQLPVGALEHDYEQMVAYRHNKDAKPKQSPWPPVGFRRDRAIWRDSQSLFQPVDGDRPRTLSALAQSGRRTRLPSQRLPLDLYGISLDQFNALFWRWDRLPLVPAYLTDDALYARLVQALSLSEESNDALRKAARRLAGLLLAPESSVGGRQPDSKAVSALVTEMAPGRRYWSRLEEPFGRYLLDQPEEREVDEHGNDQYGDHALHRWAGEVRRAAWHSLHRITDGLGTDGWSLKASVEAERMLSIGLNAAMRKEKIDERKVGAA